MPGILIALGAFPLERVRAATEKLQHIPSHSSKSINISPELAISWIGAPGQGEFQSWSAAPGHEVHVCRYGHTFKDGAQPAAIGASQIVRDYVSSGVEACYEYEGSFVIVILDTRVQRLYVVPDRLCTQPLYYMRNGDDIVIGPEVKALATATGTTPSFSREGVVGFLAAGYNIGARTLFAGVQRVELGTMLDISVAEPRQLSARRFWKLDFSSTDQLTSRPEAEEALFQSIKDGHRMLLADQPAFQILLSGGADSRGILGSCSLLGARPARALTWGLVKEAPRSDASISRMLAEQYGVPWDFVTTRSENFVDNCEQWAYVSELSNDNFGWYAEGFGTLRYLQETGCPCSFIGDESWGWGGFAYDEPHAYSLVLPSSVPRSLLALMPESRREAAASSYVDSIREVMRDCHDASWTDRKDFLYLHARVARFIFALGYNRGQVLDQRRPFLTRAVLDVVRRLPAEFRVHKNLYLTMLSRHLPDTMRAPRASVNSLPDWSYDLRVNGRLRECFLGLLHDPLIESGTLGGLIDMAAFSTLRDSSFAAVPAPVSRRIRASRVIKTRVKEILWRNPAYKYVDRWMNSRSHGRSKPQDFIQPLDILRRVAILVLLERQLHRFQDAA